MLASFGTSPLKNPFDNSRLQREQTPFKSKRSLESNTDENTPSSVLNSPVTPPIENPNKKPRLKGVKLDFNTTGFHTKIIPSERKTVEERYYYRKNVSDAYASSENKDKSHIIEHKALENAKRNKVTITETHSIEWQELDTVRKYTDANRGNQEALEMLNEAYFEATGEKQTIKVENRFAQLLDAQKVAVTSPEKIYSRTGYTSTTLGRAIDELVEVANNKAKLEQNGIDPRVVKVINEGTQNFNYLKGQENLKSLKQLITYKPDEAIKLLGYTSNSLSEVIRRAEQYTLNKTKDDNKVISLSKRYLSYIKTKN